jgi:hypothetical protein
VRKCPFSGCKARVPPDKFACRRHWFALTSEQQRRIYACYHDYIADRIDLDELRRLQREVIEEHEGRQTGS